MNAEEMLAKHEEMFGAEELHPDLAAHAYEDDVLGLCIKHPLHFSIMHAEPLNRMANKAYKAKKEAIEEYLDEGNYSGYVWLHERPYRLQAFVEIQEFLDDAKYWELLGHIWTDSENIWQNLWDWEDLLSSERPQRDAMMDEEERKLLSELPDEITVYRGYRYEDEDGDEGFSWTLDRDRANWFANRLKQDGQSAIVATGKVAKADVIAHFTGRGENEIVSMKVVIERKDEV